VTQEQPGDRRRLSQPPSARYASPEPAASGQDGSALIGPLIRADVAAAIGAAALVLVGAVLASTFGLLFVAAAMGASIGLILARAAVPAPGTDARPVARRLVMWLAVGLAIVAVAVADVATWLYARGEGGTLELFDYLWTTYGLFIPGVALVAAVAAAWGASAGPVQR
jgi:hypothetical protein